MAERADELKKDEYVSPNIYLIRETRKLKNILNARTSKHLFPEEEAEEKKDG